jgi:hypothetical protein
MRRYLFALLTSLAMFVALAAVAVASSHQGDRDRRENRDHRHPNRVEHFRAEPRAALAARSSEAGTVKSFRHRILTIKLNDGATVSGRVTRHTTVKCPATNQSFVREDGGPRPSGGDRGDQGDNNDQRDQAERNDQGDRDDQRDEAERDDQGDREDQGDRAERDDPGDANDRDADDAQNCRMALRTSGTKVRDATLRRTGAGAFWARVQLDV